MTNHVIGFTCGAICAWRAIVGIKFDAVDVFFLSVGVIMFFV